MLDITLGAEDDLVDLHDDDLSKLRYGSWERAKDGRYLVPGLLSGSDYSGSLVTQSNRKAFMEQFSDGEDVWWTSAPGGHGTYSIVIDTQGVPEDVESEVEGFLGGLASYPVADDDLLSKMEMEAQDEAWENWVEGDFKTGLEKKFEVEFDEVDSDKLRTLFEAACEKASEYWANEEGGNMWIDVKRVLPKVAEADIEALDATYVAERFEENGPGLYIVHGKNPRRSDETVYEDFGQAEGEAWELLRYYASRPSSPPVQIMEARSRDEALAGKGHVWWSDGVQHGPSVDLRQAALSFGKQEKRKSSKRSS
jgi:hypothetical protein